MKVVVCELNLFGHAHIELHLESCGQIILVTAALLQQIYEYDIFVVVH